MHAGQSESEDVVQSATGPSVRTIRGHQDPAAFLIMASGLDAHGRNSPAPLRYTHIDMAGRTGPWPGQPNAAPVAALAAHYVLPKL